MWSLAICLFDPLPCGLNIPVVFGDMLGKNLGHYRIVQQIGAGGMGVVFLAHDEQLERDVAIKILPPGTLADENARKRFRQEALSLAKLNHPNIATIHDFDTADETDFLVTEYIAGDALDKKLASGAVPSDEVVRLGLQFAQGLGDVYAASGDFANAKKSYDEALSVSTESGEKHESAVAMANLGSVLMQQGDLPGRGQNTRKSSICGTRLGRKAERRKSLSNWRI